MAQQSLRKPCFAGIRKNVIHRPLQALIHKADRVVHIRSMDDGLVHCYMPISEHDVIRPAICTTFTFSVPQYFTHHNIFFELGSCIH